MQITNNNRSYPKGKPAQSGNYRHSLQQDLNGKGNERKQPEYSYGMAECFTQRFADIHY